MCDELWANIEDVEDAEAQAPKRIADNAPMKYLAPSWSIETNS
jgi:hypothetical protein